MRAAKVQASLRIRAVSPEPSLLAHTSSESRGTFIQKARSLAPLNGWACAVKICHDGMLEDTNSLDGAHLIMANSLFAKIVGWFIPPPPQTVFVGGYTVFTSVSPSEHTNRFYSIRRLKSGNYVAKWYMCGLIFIMGKGGL